MVPGIDRRVNLILLWLCIILVAVPRVAGVTGDLYKDLAHLFMGAMLGAAWGRGIQASLTGKDYVFGAIGLSIVEVVMALYTHGHRIGL
jgi:hypothetical protein